MGAAPTRPDPWNSEDFSDSEADSHQLGLNKNFSVRFQNSFFEKYIELRGE